MGGPALDQKAIDAQKRYQQLVKEIEPKPQVGRDLWRAFLVGGVFSIIAQALFDFFTRVEPSDGEVVASTQAALILLGALLTGLGVYDKIAEWGGAGAAVPITGFANTMVAAAMDFRREGFILGLGCKMFIIAGPILVYGAIAGFCAGLARVLILGLFP